MDFFRVNDDSIVCDFPKSSVKLHKILEKHGFTFSKAYDVIAVKAASLLSSEPVRKLQTFKETGSDIYAFSELYPFQIREISDYLNLLGYQITQERLLSMNKTLSFVVFNEAYDICGVVLISGEDKELLVEFLLGTSAKSSQFILTVCGALARAFDDESLKKKDPLIKMIGVNESLSALLLKFLGNGYSIDVEDEIIHASIAIAKGKANVPEDLINTAFQQNINEKCAWKDAESKVK